jgi:hypothetical protein
MQFDDTPIVQAANCVWHVQAHLRGLYRLQRERREQPVITRARIAVYQAREAHLRAALWLAGGVSANDRRFSDAANDSVCPTVEESAW